MSAFLDNLIAFGRLLRRSGLQVDTGRVIDLAGALQLIDLSSREDVHAACRALLIQRPEDIATFDRLFDLFWTGERTAAPPLADDERRDTANAPPPTGLDAAADTGRVDGPA